LKETFSIAAILMGFVGLIPYVYGIYKRTAKPHMFSWLIWGVVSGIAGYIKHSEG